MFELTGKTSLHTHYNAINQRDDRSLDDRDMCSKWTIDRLIN